MTYKKTKLTNLQIAPWDELMSMSQSNSEVAHTNHFHIWVGHTLIKIASHTMHIRGQGLQIVHSLFDTQIASAKHVLDFVGHQQFAELGRQLSCPVGNVEVADHEHQL